MDRTTAPTTVVGVFHDRLAAQNAVNDLYSAGFSIDRVGVVIHGEASLQSGMEYFEHLAGPVEDRPAVGAIEGGILGAMVGALFAGLIPGVGPVIAGGLLAGVLAGAAVGAAGGALLTVMARMGLPEEEARRYEREFQAGRHVVAVRAEDRYPDAAAILRRHGAHFVSAHEMEMEEVERGPVRGRGGAEELGGPREEGRMPRPVSGVEGITTVPEVGILGVAETGESSPRETFGEGSTYRSFGEIVVGSANDLSITASGAVREGSRGASFGEASTGGGTVRPGSTGGGPTRNGSPGSTHDVGVRGPGTLGEGRARLEHWRGERVAGEGKEKTEDRVLEELP